MLPGLKVAAALNQLGGAVAELGGAPERQPVRKKNKKPASKGEFTATCTTDDDTHNTRQLMFDSVTGAERKNKAAVTRGRGTLDAFTRVLPTNS